jgi:hypothetical protein
MKNGESVLYIHFPRLRRAGPLPRFLISDFPNPQPRETAKLGNEEKRKVKDVERAELSTVQVKEFCKKQTSHFPRFPNSSFPTFCAPRGIPLMPIRIQPRIKRSFARRLCGEEPPTRESAKMGIGEVRKVKDVERPVQISHFPRFPASTLLLSVHPEGFEPPTLSSEG